MLSETPFTPRYARRNPRTGTISFSQQEEKKSSQQCDIPSHAESIPLLTLPSGKKRRKHLKKRHNYSTRHCSHPLLLSISRRTNMNFQPAVSHGPGSHKEKYSMRSSHPL